MYTKENLTIKKSNIIGEIPVLSDFDIDNTICYNIDGSVYEKVPVTIYDVKRTYILGKYPEVIGTISANTNNIIKGEQVTISWTSEYGIKTLLNEIEVSPIGNINYSPEETTNYTLKVVNGDDIKEYNVSVIVTMPQPILIASLDQNEITVGETTKLNWHTTYADIVKINDVEVNSSGIIDVSPTETTDYNIVATNSAGSITINLNLIVNEVVIPEKTWRTTDSTGDPDIVIPGNNIVYIDTTYTGTQFLGTIDAPYNSWSQIKRTKNTTYLFKRGTIVNTTQGLGQFLNLTNVSVGAYGSGDRPKIIATTTTATSGFYLLDIGFWNNPIEQQASSTRISGLDMSAAMPSRCNGVRGSSNLLIDNCYIHSTTWAWRSTSTAVGDPSRINNITMRDCVLESTQDDGIFIQNADVVTVDNVLVIKANQNYHTVGTSQSQAAGDGMQFNMTSKLQITNCKVDRSDTGCKFCIIIAGFIEVADNYLILDNNEFIAPIATSQGGAGLYIRDIRTNMPIIYSNNKLKGDKGLTGLWYQSNGELNSINNIYDSLSTGINKINTTSDSICTSNNDIFINCSVNTRGVTII